MSKLFRQQVTQRQSDRLHGEVLLLPRLSHLLILGFLLMWVALVIVWLSTSHYARKETVLGWLYPASGVVRIYAERDGIIKQVLVVDGEQVIKDQPLLIVNGDRIMADGQHLETLLLAEYEKQRDSLTEQLKREEKIYQQQRLDITQRLSANQQDLSLLETQIKTLALRSQLVDEQVNRYRQLQHNGHVAVSELDTVIARELELRSERQGMARNRVNLQNSYQQLQNEQVRLPEEYANRIDQVRTNLSEIARQIAELHGQRAYVVKATKAGVVNNLQARVGQQVRSSLPVLSLTPSGEALTAQLLVPVRSAGFLAPGQPLNIRYDAFPYQKFGLYTGVVTEVPIPCSCPMSCAIHQ